MSIFVLELIEPFRERLQQQQQHLIINIPEKLSLILPDISLLERVFNELINNASKYTPVEETITITAGRIRTMVFLSVSNSGIEIPPEEQESIFEKFYRIPSHDPWKYGGTGIGLALVKKLVELLDATIKLDSQAGQTTFTIQFYPQNKNSKDLKKEN